MNIPHRKRWTSAKQLTSVSPDIVLHISLNHGKQPVLCRMLSLKAAPKGSTGPQLCNPWTPCGQRELNTGQGASRNRESGQRPKLERAWGCPLRSWASSILPQASWLLRTSFSGHTNDPQRNESATDSLNSGLCLWSLRQGLTWARSRTPTLPCMGCKLKEGERGEESGATCMRTVPLPRQAI